MTDPHDTPRTDERAGLSEAERDALRMVMETSSTSWLNLRRRVETAVERIITDRHAGRGMTAPHDAPRTDERAGLISAKPDERDHWREQAARLAAVAAERDAAVARVAAVEALADEWAEQVRRGHAENPSGHAALSTHERDLEELRAALAAPVSADLSDRGEA